MHIGIETLPTSNSIDVAVLAKRVEELGFESLWTPDQPVLAAEMADPFPREWGDIVDPLIMLSRASAVTSTIKLGTVVLVVTQREPISLAKQVATLDMYSDGRFIFGIGVGSSPEQAAILGSNFHRRWAECEEITQALKALWIEDKSEFHGEYVDFPPVYCFPKPVAKPHPPILLGSKAKNVFERIIYWGNGWIPLDITPEEVHLGRLELDRLANEAGRDPDSIEITIAGVGPNKDAIKDYAKAGADRVLVSLESAPEKVSLVELQKIADSVLT